MRGKNACIVVDLRGGQHVVKVPDMVAVLSAAGWKTTIALKEYGGETLKLAQQAARDGYDMIISYGGDGTLNAVFNGVMAAGGKSVVADIPGGTYNVWASAIDIPNDPVKAALALVNSEARKIDLAHVEVDGLVLPGSEEQEANSQNEKSKKKPKRSSRLRQYFLLHVGIGIDAAIMAHISKPLKYSAGPLAFDLATLKELPTQRPFPVEVRALDDAGNVETHWQGEAWDILISKVPYFGGEINIQPEARVDDGQLYISLITANGPLKTIEQVASILLQHKLQDDTTRYFRGPHFSIRVPASIGMHVDGSIVKVEDFLRKSEQDIFQQMSRSSPAMVDYRFDAEPKVLRMAVPRTYNGSLFTNPHSHGNAATPADEPTAAPEPQSKKMKLEQEKRSQDGQGTAYTLTVVGATPNPEQPHTYIVAGSYKKLETDDTQIVAASIDDATLIFNESDERASAATVMGLQEGSKIEVKGNKTKRGVIPASSIKILHAESATSEHQSHTENT